ncbi:hypothetical protein DFJ58DRAFT_749037 [Suillus subalutaceus]|uniref:uncharacterized protein n=1 Tax=Suillus subalutaceus TaxID=48586 RepID=UPI001B880971|nr:uncharacterized protein DFJ58DRAFT_749037 [Suillus subalutaceus]KAG1839311.1 hypothetical protein DFJ58DRAFT_749037 [Suillus subalutaceus]
MPANSADSTDPSAAKTDLQGLNWRNITLVICFTQPAQHSENGPTISSIASKPIKNEYGYGVEPDDVWLVNSIKTCIAQIEEEMDLEAELEEVNPRSTKSNVPIHSPTTPMYIDVHFKYYCRARMSETEWFYSLGYKIQRRPPATAGDPDAIDEELGQGGPQDVHVHNGWQSICWVELYKEGVMDVYETLFGELERPATTDAEAMLAYRRSLVKGKRLLLAAVGLSYEVACTDHEIDVEPRDLMLEGLSDRLRWVGRGIRNACGLRLTRDAEGL